MLLHLLNLLELQLKIVHNFDTTAAALLQNDQRNAEAGDDQDLKGDHRPKDCLVECRQRFGLLADEDFEVGLVGHLIVIRMDIDQ